MSQRALVLRDQVLLFYTWRQKLQVLFEVTQEVVSELSKLEYSGSGPQILQDFFFLSTVIGKFESPFVASRS